MSSKILELDPQGDIELILLYPNTQVLQWPGRTYATKTEGQMEQNRDRDNNTFRGESVPYSTFSTFGQFVEPADPPPPPVPGLNLEPAPDAIPVAEFNPEIASEPSIASEPAGTEQELATGPTSGSEDPNALGTLSFNEEPNELRMLVSSQHLCLASSTFRKMLRGPWHEGISEDKEIREIETSDWDAEAFLIVLDIIHGHYISVPESVSLETLAHIAAIVDFYDCHEITKTLVGLWIKILESSLPSLYGKECVLWMSISWVFLRVDILQEMARIAATDSQGPIDTMSLPLPDILSRTIENKRQETLRKGLQSLHDLRDTLCNESMCITNCTYMLLGSLTRQIHEAGIPKKLVGLPLYGYSINWLKQFMSGLTSPVVYTSPRHRSCLCKLEDRVRPLLEECLHGMENLGLEGIWSKRMEERESKRVESMRLRTEWKNLSTEGATEAVDEATF